MRRRTAAPDEEPLVDAVEVLIPPGTGEEMSVDNKVRAAEQEAAKGLGEDDEEPTPPPAGCCFPETSPAWVAAKLGVCVLAGLVFGLALEKGRVFEPEAIRNQMVFKQWTMLKMFIAAMATGQLVFALMSVIPSMRPLFSYIYVLFLQTLKEKGILTTTLGPFILGVGMTFAGACPGMVLAQMGSWTKNAIFSFIGALLGALVYGICQPFIRKLTMPAKSFKTFSLADHTGVFFGWIAFPMAIAMLAAVAALEYFIPWHEDLPLWSRNENDTTNFLFLKAWPPSIAGAMIGVLQILIAVSVKDTLGGSSSYMTLCAQWVIPVKVQNTFPHLAKFRCGIANWWQVFYVVSAMLGALGSSCLSGSTGTTRGVGIPWAISGGFMMLFGARLSSGCTSGHGLSGAAMLVYISLIAVPVMFAGGIATAFAMEGFGVLNNYVCPEGPCTNTT